MEIRCPKGHLSTDVDYCSECGAKIAGTPSGLAAVQSPPTTSGAAGGSDETCPDCGTRRANTGAVFCEVCRYNFVTHTSWAVPSVSPTPPPPAPDPVPATVGAAPIIAAPPPDPAAVSAPPAPDLAAAPPTAAPLAAAQSASRWQAVVTVDPSLYVDPDPQVPCPTDEPARLYHLDFDENLIGRRSDRRDIHPEINLRDPGASHRHAKLLRQPDGGLVLLDVGSTNGTLLNGAEAPEGVPTPLKDGDEIVLGCWTRITLREVRS